jgi:signal transduction histidine kinase
MRLRGHLSRRLAAVGPRPHLPRRTVRLRLTVLYGLLFLVAGAALLVATNFLVDRATGVAGGNSVVVVHGGKEMTLAEAKKATGAGFDVVYRGREMTQAEAGQIRAGALNQRDNDVRTLYDYSLVAFGAMVVLSTLFGWVVAGRALRPLRDLSSSAQSISATNLQCRLPLDGPDDELKELGTTFNQLLDRLERSFESQRRFVANASHELRSPLARQRAIAQVALTDPEATVDSLRAAHERVLAAGEQQERLLDALLTLARGEAGSGRREALDLAGVVRSVLGQLPREVAALALRLEPSLAPSPLVGDSRLVERMVANLVDNAARYNVPGGRIGLFTTTMAGKAVLSVENTGPQVPQGHIQRLFQPFQRMERDRTGCGDGVGLGLSIVQAVALSHGAQVDATSRSEGGLEITISFPPVPAGAGNPTVWRAPGRATRYV